MNIITKKKITAKDLLELAAKPAPKKAKAGEKVPQVTAPVSPPVNHGKVVNYYVEYEDGTTLLAQGTHAHLVFRFTMEAQKLATMHAFAYYEGPGMKEFSKDEALKLIAEFKGE